MKIRKHIQITGKWYKAVSAKGISTDVCKGCVFKNNAKCSAANIASGCDCLNIIWKRSYFTQIKEAIKEWKNE